jgi:glycosyltransferase involved in cell wall biosynthesis
MTHSVIYLNNRPVIGFGDTLVASTPPPIQIEALVPAYNEAPTIEAVIAALKGAPSITRVVVIDDGSKDDTAAVATKAGATVIQMNPNGGKGNAMLAGLRTTTSEHVGFFDADLYGLKSEHVELMVSAAAQGFDMVCGLRDYGLLLNPWQLTGPVITGERIVTRQLLNQIPMSCWSGYAIETAMNDAARRTGAHTVCVMLPGVTIRNKVQKDGGFLHGLWGHVKMMGEIIKTSNNLEDSCGTSCTIGGAPVVWP